MIFKDKKLLIGMITTVCFLCLLGLSFTKACAASKPCKQKNASIEDNLKKFLLLYNKERESEKSEPLIEPFLSSLDQESHVQLARKLLKESNGRIVYIGANLLILGGHEGEAIPALAELITSGREVTDLNDRLGYDWEHNPDAYPWSRIYTGICRYMISNWPKYTAGERVRAYGYLSDTLQLDSHGTFSADVVERALKKLESELSKN